mmetsp:Transcript_112302/g.328395  ORF Transcript_112302/g.328395 Transcript_112302/m.328395 type:complete len:219 (-) Transcript_112302:252-908(-)
MAFPLSLLRPAHSLPSECLCLLRALSCLLLLALLFTFLGPSHSRLPPHLRLLPAQRRAALAALLRRGRRPSLARRLGPRGPRLPAPAGRLGLPAGVPPLRPRHRLGPLRKALGRRPRLRALPRCAVLPRRAALRLALAARAGATSCQGARLRPLFCRCLLAQPPGLAPLAPALLPPPPPLLSALRILVGRLRALGQRVAPGLHGPLLLLLPQAPPLAL